MVFLRNACFFVLILLADGGEEVLTELFRENSVDFRPDHAAFLIRCECRRVCFEALTNDIRLDSFRGGCHEFRLSVNGLTEEGISLGVEFCRQVLQFFFFGFFDA